jgi:hypothetical protein
MFLMSALYKHGIYNVEMSRTNNYTSNITPRLKLDIYHNISCPEKKTMSSYGYSGASLPSKHKPIKNDLALRTQLKGMGCERLSDKSLRLIRMTLTDASRKVPKYLFRMWDKRSGGDSRLNTPKTITPHAFRDSRGHKSVYDMSRSEFVHNTSLHVNFGTGSSEFSSWSHSPFFVFGYAQSRKPRQEAHIAIIDTEELAQSNPAFYVPVLGQIFHRPEVYSYDEEYLVHGVITGPSYRAVPFKKLCELGLSNQISCFDDHLHSFSGNAKAYSRQELCELKTIALPYGPKFSIPFAIMLFCCKKRPEQWANLSAKDLNKIIDILGGREVVPMEWCSSPSVFCDGIYPRGYEANQQMANLMRALHTHCWGKGARSTARYTSEKPKTVGDTDAMLEKMSSMSFE